MENEANTTIPAEWSEALDRSEAQLANGQIVSGGAVRSRPRASIAVWKPGSTEAVTGGEPLNLQAIAFSMSLDALYQTTSLAG